MLPVNAGPRTATVTLVRTQTLARPSAAARQAAEPAPTVKPSPRVISKPIGRANGCINQSPEHQRSRSNRHSSLHPHPKPARDFVPWRFSDAAVSARGSPITPASEKPEQIQPSGATEFVGAAVVARIQKQICPPTAFRAAESLKATIAICSEADTDATSPSHERK